MSFLKYISSAFTQPKSEKLLLRMIRELKPQSIVELGIGDGERTSQLIAAASKHADVTYCGIDLFEASPTGSAHLTLKDAHRKFSGLPARIRLLPGDTNSTLRRSANELTGTDLLIIPAPFSGEDLDTVWTYAPRMLVATSRVLIESADDNWKTLTCAELPKPATVHRKRTAA